MALFLNIYEVKARLSELLASFDKKNDKIVICKHNKPIAEITPLHSKKGKQSRKFGFAKNKIILSNDFNAPLESNIEDSFWKAK